mmetsp:Transcript_74492/g.206334  ORF Transcript_74492/g.206334 Transcript_74492/m.206334 type:complete len:168 (-) Transcript_74492:335-838(-)
MPRRPTAAPRCAPGVSANSACEAGRSSGVRHNERDDRGLPRVEVVLVRELADLPPQGLQPGILLVLPQRHQRALAVLYERGLAECRERRDVGRQLLHEVRKQQVHRNDVREGVEVNGLELRRTDQPLELAEHGGLVPDVRLELDVERAQGALDGLHVLRERLSDGVG